MRATGRGASCSQCVVCPLDDASINGGWYVMSLPLATLWRDELSEAIADDPRLMSTDSEVALRNALNWASACSGTQVFLPFTIRPHRKTSRSEVLLWAERLCTGTESKGFLVGLEWGLAVGWHCHGVLALRAHIDRDLHRSHTVYSVHFGRFSRFAKFPRTIIGGDSFSNRFRGRMRPDLRPWLRYCCKDGLLLVYVCRRLRGFNANAAPIADVTPSDVIDMADMRERFTPDHVAHDVFDASRV